MPQKQPPAPCVHVNVDVTSLRYGVMPSYSWLQSNLPPLCLVRSSHSYCELSSLSLGALAGTHRLMALLVTRTPAPRAARCSDVGAGGVLGALDLLSFSLFGDCKMAPLGEGLTERTRVGREGSREVLGRRDHFVRFGLRFQSHVTAQCPKS